MAVANQNNKDRLPGNGIVKNFTYDFPIQTSDTLYVYRIDTTTTPETELLLTEGIDYTVVISLTSEAFTVTTTGTLTVDEELFAIRIAPLTQSTPYPISNNTPEKSFENALDKLTFIAQQLNEENDRTLGLRAAYNGLASTELPDPEASTLLGWDALASKITNYSLPELGFPIPSVFGAKLMTSADAIGARTLLNCGGYINVKDYGATGNGVTDDYIFFANAIAAASGKKLLIPSGTYKIGSNLTFTNLDLCIEKGGLLQPALGKVITLNCSVTAGIYKIFDLSATGTFTGDILTPWIYPQWFGAIATLPNDCTAAIQAALTLAEAKQAKGKTVYFPAGFYLVSSTLNLTGYTAQGINLLGEGITRTRIYRTGDYGDTLIIGDASHSSVENTKINGLTFWHYSGYSSGQPPAALINPVTSGSHITFYGAVRAEINNCMFLNMKRSILFYGGSTNEISYNVFQGLYDHAEPTLQEMDEEILFAQHPLGGLPTDYRLRDNSHVGYLSPSRSVTYGTWTGNIVENIGPQSAIRILAAEVIQISGGNIGGCNDAGISINPQTGIGCLSIYISGVFFDGNRLAGVRIVNAGSAMWAFGVNINDNIFIGQNNSDNAIWVGAAGDTTPSAVGLNISGNQTLSYVKGSVMLLSGKGINVEGNQIRHYNSLGGFAADNFNATGIYIGANTEKVHVHGNNMGGGAAFEDYGALNHCEFGITYSATPTYITLSDNVDFGTGTFTQAIT